MGVVYVEYVGKKVGSFNVTANDRRVYRVSNHQPLILVNEDDLGYFASRSDFSVPRVARKANQVSGVQVGPLAVEQTITSRKRGRPPIRYDERGTKKVYP